MKYPILTALAATTLLAGCLPPVDIGGGNDSEKFRLEFSPVRAVTLDSWGGDPRPLSGTNGTTPSEPPNPPTLPGPSPRTVRIEGRGTVEQSWRNSAGPYPTFLQRGHISLSYAFVIDNGCKDIAQKAQQEGRSLVVEGFGTVAEAVAMMACYPTPGPVPVGGSTEPGTPTNACPYPSDPGEEPGGTDGSTSAGTGGTDSRLPIRCGCPPVLPSFFVRAEKLVSCSLGGNVTLPPTPGPSPLPPVPSEPEPKPL